jgi:hypothetical protein
MCLLLIWVEGQGWGFLTKGISYINRNSLEKEKRKKNGSILYLGAVSGPVSKRRCNAKYRVSGDTPALLSWLVLGFWESSQP